MRLHSHPSGGAKQRDRSSSIQEYQCFELWDLQRHHTLECGCFKHRALLSIHGAVSNWCKQFGLTEEERELERPLARKESVTKGVLSSVSSQELKLSVSSPRLASGNRLQKNIRDFESLSGTNRFTRVCEDAVFTHRVSAGKSYKTRPHEDDGFGQLVPLFRE